METPYKGEKDERILISFSASGTVLGSGRGGEVRPFMVLMDFFWHALLIALAFFKNHIIGPRS